MATFADRVCLRLLDDAFVSDLFDNQIGLDILFDLVYQLDGDSVEALALSAVRNRQFQRPIFETVRTRGSDQRTLPQPERVSVDREQPRNGRLAWVDVSLELDLEATVRQGAGQVQSVGSTDLLQELGDPQSLAELTTALTNRFGETVVAEAFEKLKIDSLEQFRERGSLFLEVVSEPAPPFDVNDSANLRGYPLGVCVRLQDSLDLTATLQTSKLCREVLEHERTYAELYEDTEVKRPCAFVVLFPDSLAVDGAITGLTAQQIKDSTRQLFANEEMEAHFLTGF